MFKRLARLIKSWLGYFISFAEDPEVMLQESIEEMRNTMPRLNQILVTTRATVIRLEQEKNELEQRERQLVRSIQAALKEGSAEARKIAETDALALQQVRQELTATREQHMAASNAAANAQLSVEDIKGRLRVRIEECRRAIAESKKAEVMKSAADALAELDTYGTAATAEKYLEEIKQKVAESKAAVEVSTGGLDIERIKMERKARDIQAQAILSEFEVEMGLKKPDAVREAAPFPDAGAARPAAQKLPEGGGS
jgi:phage shock protein A